MSEAIPHLEGKRTGRPRGSNGGITKMAREAAIKTGLLPHEWLLKVARGEGIEHKRWVETTDARTNVVTRQLVSEVVYAAFDERIDAAKAAAPYYAPRLVAQQVDVTGSMQLLQMSDDELNAELAALAAALRAKG